MNGNIDDVVSQGYGGASRKPGRLINMMANSSSSSVSESRSQEYGVVKQSHTSRVSNNSPRLGLFEENKPSDRRSEASLRS
jgi:hypothetical protein